MAGRHRRVTWTRRAQSALNDALAYIAEHSPQAARSVLGETLVAAADLAIMSRRGRVVPELGDPRVREVFVHKYRLMYEVTADEVRVLAFVHGSRDFAAWRTE